MADAVRRMRVFAGPNGSGKSTIKTLLEEDWIGVYVNADDIERSWRETGAVDLKLFQIPDVPDLQERAREAFRNSGLLKKATLNHLAERLEVQNGMVRLPDQPLNSYIAGALADFIRRSLLEAELSFTFETVMSYKDKVEFMREAQERGYRTYLYFVATADPLINVARVQSRVEQDGHPVAEAAIVDRYSKCMKLLGPAVAASNRAYIFDNSGEGHVLLAEVAEGSEMELHEMELPEWFMLSDLGRPLLNESGSESEGAQAI